MTRIPPAEGVPLRTVVCLRCGHIDTQRQAPGGKWLWAYCKHCNDGRSLYLRLPSVAGWRPGAYVGDGSTPPDQGGTRFYEYSGNCGR